jgi:hypothetical protein
MAMIYRHGPSLPALVSAGVVFFSGALLVFSLYQQEQAGEGTVQTVALVGCLTFVITVSLVIMAFARYQYTHLWKSTKASHSDKYKKPGLRSRSRRKGR